MKRPQRLAMNYQRDRDMLGTANTVEMVLDVACDEVHFVEIVEVIDYSQFCNGCCFVSCACARGHKGCPKVESAPHRILLRCMASFRPN